MFPCEPRDKHPLGGHGHLDATTDEARIREWWSATPDANIGMPMRSNGLVAVDVDPRNGGNATFTRLQTEHGWLPLDCRARTGGGGDHFVMRDPGGELRGKLGDGVDFKVDGYILVEPSVHPSGGRYSWTGGDPVDAPAVPEAWVEVVRRRSTERPLGGIDGDAPPASPAVLAEAAAHAMRRGPAVQGRGGDNHTYSVCAALLHDWALTEAEAWPILQRWNATCEPPWDRNELKQKMANAMAYASGPRRAARVVFEDAEELGAFLMRGPMRKTAPTPIEVIDLSADPLVASGQILDALAYEPPGDAGAETSWLMLYRQALADVRAALSAPGHAGGEPEPLFMPASELLHRNFPPTPWLAEGLCKRGGTLVVGGEPKTGKSWVLTELSMAVATGGRVFGEFGTGEPTRVAYFYAEDLGEDVQAHLRALAVGRGMSPDDAVRNMHVQPRGKFLDVLRDEDVALVVASCRRIGEVGLVCIEPLRDVHSAEENESDGMIAVMRRLRVIGELLGGATVAVAHHLTKAADGKRGGNALRGSGAIRGSLDSGIYLHHRESTPTLIANAVEVEIKGARGAGRFDLALGIVDGPAGTAERATWEVKRDGASAPQVSDADEARLVAVVEKISLITSRGEAATYNRVYEMVKGATKTFAAAIEAGKDRGLIEIAGPRRGYRLTPEGQEFARPPDDATP